MINFDKHLKEWIELSSGVSLLYQGPNMEEETKPDVFRLLLAIESDNIDEMEHVIALLIPRIIYIEGTEFIPKKWSELSHVYHNNFCVDCIGSHNKIGE